MHLDIQYLESYSLCSKLYYVYICTPSVPNYSIPNYIMSSCSRLYPFRSRSKLNYTPYQIIRHFNFSRYITSAMYLNIVYI